MASGLLSLKWNHHRSTFLHVLANIRQKEAYCDVTLACAGKFYSAHKLVLSTCSEYFEEMFDRTQCKHPVIVLKDIGYEELEALLSYMYDGEVNVMQDNLSNLIKAAECLKIKGLAVADSDPSDHLNKDKSGGSSKDVNRSHSSSSNSNYHGDSSSGRQHRNVNNSNNTSLKRPMYNSKQDNTQPTKRRRSEQVPQTSSTQPSTVPSSSPSPSTNNRASESSTPDRTSNQNPPTSSASSSSENKTSKTEPPDQPSTVGESPPVAGDDSSAGVENNVDGSASVAQDEENEAAADEVPEDSRAFAQGISDETGVKAEPVEVIDSDDGMAGVGGVGDGYDQPAGESSDAEFTEEKFQGDGVDHTSDPNSLWGASDAADLFAQQPSTSSYTGGEGGDNRSKSGSGAGNSSASGPIHESSSTSSEGGFTLQQPWPTASVFADFCESQRSPSTLPLKQQRSNQHLQQQRSNPHHYRSKVLHSSGEETTMRMKCDAGENSGTMIHDPDASILAALSSDRDGSDHLNLPSTSSSLSSHFAHAIHLQSSPTSIQSLTSEEVLASNMETPVISPHCFSCTYCYYTTNIKRHFDAHLRTHTYYSKSFPCPECPYVAMQLSNLKAHSRKHTGEKPYTCDVCLKSFTQHISLHKHLKVHPSEAGQKCGHCGQFV